MLGMFTLIALGFLVLIINPAIPITREITDAAGATDHRSRRVRAGHIGRANPRRLPRDLRIERGEGARARRRGGLVASFHAIIFAYGRQIYSLSRAGYFPHFLSVTHGEHKTPNMALVAGAAGRARRDAGGVVRHGRR